jgi:hypothetical protein
MSDRGLGFKTLTPANWKEADLPAYTNGLLEPEWLAAVLQPQVHADVPKDVRALFEVARGTLMYGWFFYPLCTLASEQSFRVLDTALKIRCAQLGLPATWIDQRGKTRHFMFANNVARLVKAKVISDTKFWESSCELRNDSSHPSFQTLLPPGIILASFQSVAKHLNHLFPHASAHPT